MEENGVRIDILLKVARFYKQRERAAEAVESGKVRLNGERTKPGRHVKLGDEPTIKRDKK